MSTSDDGRTNYEDNPHAFDVLNLHVMVQGALYEKYRFFVNLASPGSGAAVAGPVIAGPAGSAGALFGDEPLVLAVAGAAGVWLWFLLAVLPRWAPPRKGGRLSLGLRDGATIRHEVGANMRACPAGPKRLYRPEPFGARVGDLEA